MKRQISKKIRGKPLLTRLDLALTLVPALIWLFLVHSRAALITPHCITEPLSCGAETVFAPDRIVLGLASPLADAWSFKTQFAAAWLALLVPLAWSFITAGEWAKFWTKRWEVTTDLILFLETILWNGVATEAIRVLVQRPRPFVYSDPANLGRDPAHYTSFVSGHASFTAAASACLILTLLARKAPRSMTTFFSFIGIALVTLTGLFRVLSGRHFVTDVAAGAMVGTVVAFAVALMHRNGHRNVHKNGLGVADL